MLCRSGVVSTAVLDPPPAGATGRAGSGPGRPRPDVGRSPAEADPGPKAPFRLGRGRGSRVRRPAGACHPSTMKGTAMTTMVEDARVITGGVDTQAGMHVAAALNPIGELLGVQEFPATAAGYASLLSWLRSSGTLAAAGVEGTGSYGAGLARHLAAAGVRVVEVDRPDRQDRARQGKSGPAGCGQRGAGGAVGKGVGGAAGPGRGGGDRKSTRLNSSHPSISY